MSRGWWHYAQDIGLSLDRVDKALVFAEDPESRFRFHATPLTRPHDQNPATQSRNS